MSFQIFKHYHPSKRLKNMHNAMSSSCTPKPPVDGQTDYVHLLAKRKIEIQPLLKHI
jgi:hypothetical protein